MTTLRLEQVTMRRIPQDGRELASRVHVRDVEPE